MRRKQLASLTLLSWAVILIAAIAIIGGGIMAVRRFSANLSALSFLSFGSQVVPFHEYFALDPEVMGVIVEDRRITDTEPPMLIKGEVYLPTGLVREYMDPFLFWDAKERMLYITTDTEAMQFMPGVLEYRSNIQNKSIESPVTLIGETAYFPASLAMQFYEYDIEYVPEFNMAVVTDRNVSHRTGVTLKKTDLHYRPESKAPITRKAVKGETLTLYEQDGDFTRIRTEDGLLGYVLTSAVAEKESANPTQPGMEAVTDNTVQPNDSVVPINGKINLMWDAIYSTHGNESVMSQPLPDGLNVIAPTWFTFHESTFDMISLSSTAYVEWAHGQGCQVWGTVTDESGDIAHAVLSDYENRRKAINQLAEQVDTYGLDGINIDFEHVREEDGDYYIQFLRELAIVLRQRGVILSVDVYVPSGWSEYYSRDRIGLTADYVCVMTYDEHYSKSPESGPVASLGFVEKGVLDMLEEVPKEKLLMGLPYYNRIWREIANNDSPETRKVQHEGMEKAKSRLADNGVTPEWDPVSGYYYGEYAAVENNETVLYRVWLEDENSITEKLNLFQAHDLAGVAGWRRGFENEQVWDLLKSYCNLD